MGRLYRLDCFDWSAHLCLDRQGHIGLSIHRYQRDQLFDSGSGPRRNYVPDDIGSLRIQQDCQDVPRFGAQSSNCGRLDRFPYLGWTSMVHTVCLDYLELERLDRLSQLEAFYSLRRLGYRHIEYKLCRYSVHYLPSEPKS